MESDWSFGRKVGLGFAVAVLTTVAIGVTADVAMSRSIASKDAVIELASRVLVDCTQLETLAERAMATHRGFLLTGEATYERQRDEAEREFRQVLERVRKDADAARREVEATAVAFDAYMASTEELMNLRRSGISDQEINARLQGDVRDKRLALSRTVNALFELESQALTRLRTDATVASEAAATLLMTMASVSVVLCAVIAIALTRTLGRQIGSAVGQIQSSSTELQAAANQQASGSREQATAVTEITTTIQELLATSRQIAESAQRVSQVAMQTANAAQGGELTVGRAQDAIASIQRQSDLIVGHMLELGKKSQQIGTVLDIVSELAEQTNILAINATIEASLAGDVGKRFGVVADEIRKLADRVTSSTKEVRGLIDEVRAAVNTTVMATETGAKTVDAGTRQFSDVTGSLTQIKGLVITTNEAAREIELSTKQQASAVEQVSTAIVSVGQAAKEFEATSTQTIQAVSQLSKLANALLRVIRPEAAERA